MSKLKLVKGDNLEGKIIHKCSMCGLYGTWDENWSWFGSYSGDEDIYKLCSETCKEEFRKTKMYKIVKLKTKGLK